MIKRRENHEPLAYILGHKEFYSLDFKVTRDTLIPRPETEHLVEEIIKLKSKNKNIVDIGTGSGNIIIALANNIKAKNNYYGIDISSRALNIAKHNAKINKVDKVIKFYKSDLLNNRLLLKEIKNRNTIIVANLPYLSETIYNSTSQDVKNFEPKSALLSGKDGLGHYEKLFKQINKLLSIKYKIKNIISEISPEQKSKVEKLAKKYFPSCRIIFFKDLSGRWRVAKIEL